MGKSTFVVLGSNSFSGGWMVNTLLADNPRNKVIGISRSPEKNGLFLAYKPGKDVNFSFHQMDINTDTKKIFALLDEIKPAYIINFMAQGEVGTSWRYPEQWFETNAVGMVKLCNFLKDRNYLKRYVHISTPEVYGSCKNVRESYPLNPSTPYAASKAAADLFIFTLVKQYHFPVIMIRSTNVYGKHQQLYRIIPRSLLYIKMGKKIPLQGGGRAIKSYLHIKDVCLGILLALKSGSPGSVYHFSPDDSISIKELVSKICAMAGYKFEKCVESIEDRPGQDAAYIIDSSKSRRELGWTPKITMEQGLSEVARWINTDYKKLKKQPLDYVHLP